MAELIEDNEIEELAFKRTEEPVNKSRQYIDDDVLTPILAAWSIERKAALERGDENLPPIPNEAAISILDMADNLGKRFNFSGYSYLDDMKSDAILHCVKYIHNFNPNKKSEKKGKVSAFGYINMIIWRSFTHRIEEEKREQYFKYKSFQLMGGTEAFQDEDMNDISGGGEDGGSMSISVIGADFLGKIAEYEEKYGLNKVKVKGTKTVEFDNFMFDLMEDSGAADLDMNFDEDKE